MSKPDAPTAIIAANGWFGIGAMLEAQSMGLRVPQDLSIVSFDDFEIMSQLPTPISAIRVPSAEIGEKLAEVLIAYLAGNTIPEVSELEAEFFARASSGPPPAAAYAATSVLAGSQASSKHPQAKRSR